MISPHTDEARENRPGAERIRAGAHRHARRSKESILISVPPGPPEASWTKPSPIIDWLFVQTTNDPGRIMRWGWYWRSTASGMRQSSNTRPLSRHGQKTRRRSIILATLSGCWEISEAEKHLRDALALRAEFPLAHFNLGCVYKAQGKVADAKQEWEQALAPEAGLCGGQSKTREFHSPVNLQLPSPAACLKNKPAGRAVATPPL